MQQTSVKEVWGNRLSISQTPATKSCEVHMPRLNFATQHHMAKAFSVVHTAPRLS